MLICKVKGKLVATIKNEKLQGCSFVIVQPVGKSNVEVGNPFVALDKIGCGVGETVLITQGLMAQYAIEKNDIPIDSVIIGIVDYFDVND